MSNNSGLKDCKASKDFYRRCPYYDEGKCLNKRGCPYKGAKEGSS